MENLAMAVFSFSTDNEPYSNSDSLKAADTIVYSNKANNVVTNNGVLWATGPHAAVFFDINSADATITNQSVGYIKSDATAIVLKQSSGTISNAGEIVSSSGGASALQIQMHPSR
jgi:hypothetical protein